MLGLNGKGLALIGAIVLAFFGATFGAKVVRRPEPKGSVTAYFLTEQHGRGVCLYRDAVDKFCDVGPDGVLDYVLEKQSDGSIIQITKEIGPDPWREYTKIHKGLIEDFVDQP